MDFQLRMLSGKNAVQHCFVCGVMATALCLAACQTEQERLAEPEVGMSTMAGASLTERPNSVGETQTPTPSQDGVGSLLPSSTPSQPTATVCGTSAGMDAVRQNLHQLPDQGWPWDAQWADVSGFDPCAALSWAVVPIEGGTASSPYHIMLFHQGEYLGTATARAYGFSPKVNRTDDATLAVTYTYELPGDSVALASGRAYATFRWDEGQQRVIMTGDVPPV